ncbi:hypothetical protein U1Q18_037074 [Sarracenia purpurea var. burkii]
MLGSSCPTSTRGSVESPLFVVVRRLDVTVPRFNVLEPIDLFLMKNGRLRRGAEWRWRKNRGFVVPVGSAAFSAHRERRWACLCRFGDPKGILKFGLQNFAITISSLI